VSIKRNKNIGGKDENKKKVCPCRGCLPCGIAHGTGNDIACGGR